VFNKYLICGAALLSSSPAFAQDYRGVAFGGGTIADGASGYAGAVVALPGGRLGKGFAVRGSANVGSYRYDVSGTAVEAEYVGAEAAVVYQTSGDWGWANFSAGPRVSDLSLSPDDLANERRGTTWDLGLQTDGAIRLDPRWRLDFYGSIGALEGAFQTRLGVGRLVNEARQTRIGIESAVQGDPRYTTVSGGAFVATQLARNLEGQFSAGALGQEGRDVRPYASVGVSVLF
jgi:hypothetical protein